MRKCPPYGARVARPAAGVLGKARQTSPISVTISTKPTADCSRMAGGAERMNAAIRVAVAAALAILAGCASGAQRTLPQPVESLPPGPGMARVAVVRTTDMLFLGLGAEVSINDQRAGTIWRGERTVADVPAGLTTVAITAFGSPGRFVLRFPTVPSGIYGLEVAPRGASFAPAMLFGYLGAMMDAASNPEQGGSFTLSAVSATPPIGTPPPPPAPVSVVATAGDREDRLLELRRLRDRGLISEDVYRDEQRRVLGPLTGGLPR